MNNPRYNTIEELIAALSGGEQHISFSSLKRFLKPEGTPRKFAAYYLEPKPPSTKVMLEGKVLDALMDENEEAFNSKYLVADVPPRNSNKGKAAYNALIEQLNGRALVPEKMYKHMNYLRDCLYKNGPARWLLEQTTETQRKVSGTIDGFPFKGVIDWTGDEMITDLKLKKDSGPRKAFWQIRDAHEALQVSLYNLLDCDGAKQCFTVIVDRDGEVIVVEYDEHDQRGELEKLKYGLEELHECLMTGPRAFQQSRDFHAFRQSGIYNYREL